MLSILFTLPDGFLDAMTNYVSAIFTDAKLLIILGIGLPLAFFIAKRVIALAPRG